MSKNYCCFFLIVLCFCFYVFAESCCLFSAWFYTAKFPVKFPILRCLLFNEIESLIIPNYQRKRKKENLYCHVLIIWLSLSNQHKSLHDIGICNIHQKGFILKYEQLQQVQSKDPNIGLNLGEWLNKQNP